MARPLWGCVTMLGQDQVFSRFLVSHILDLVFRICSALRTVIDLMVWFEILEEIWFQLQCYRFAPNSNLESATSVCVIVVLKGL